MAIPLPQPFSQQPGGGINAVMAANNALARKQLENMYYAPMAAAQMASQTAYARMLGPQIAGNIMNSPGWNLLSPQQQKAIAQQAAQGFQNIQDSGIITNSMGFNPQMGGGAGGGGGGGGGNPFQAVRSFDQPGPRGLLGNFPSPNASYGASGGGLLNALSNWASGGAPQQQAPQNALMGGGPSDRMSDREVEDIAMNGNGQQPIGANTPAAQQMGGKVMPGSEPITPTTAADIQQKKTERAVVGGQEAQTEQQKQRSQQVSQDAMVARTAIQNLQAAIRNYDKSAYVGQRAGSYPSSGQGSLPVLPGHTSAPEQLVDAYMNDVIQGLQALKGTPVGSTDMARGILTESKPSRSMDRPAFQEKSHSMLARLSRLENYRHFINDFYKRNPNATDEQLVGMLNLYDQKAPPYDFEKGKALPENNKRFREFTSPEALKQYMETGDYEPPKKQAAGKPAGRKERQQNVITLEGGYVVPREWQTEDAERRWYLSLPPEVKKAYRKYKSGAQ